MSLGRGLARLRGKIAPALSASDQAQIFSELERGLLAADAGTKATRAFVAAVREQAGAKPSLAEVGTAVRNQFAAVLSKLHQAPVARSTKPHVVMLIGANGSGKTTIAARLGKQEIDRGGQVVLGACDTFRAAASEQLTVWAERLGERARVVSGAQDPAAVAFNAVSAAVANKADLVIIDTAGRQSNNRALMAEAQKIHRAVSKAMADAPHEVVYTLDANTGQNALAQLSAFEEGIGVSGIAITKLDTTARGGVLLAIAMSNPKPVLLVGVGEGADDLIDFDPSSFADALLAEGNSVPQAA